jgi:hypothetical protein
MNTIRLVIEPADTQPALEARLEAVCLYRGFEPAPNEEERFVDIERFGRRSRLLHAVEARRGVGEHGYSSPLVIEQAADRFFELVSIAEDSLQGRFTDAEFLTILTSTCSPVWTWHRHTSVASMVARHQGIDSMDDLTAGNPLRALLESLLELTPVENAALVDVCERHWRGHNNPLL